MAGSDDKDFHVLRLPLVVNDYEAFVLDQRLRAVGKLRNAALSKLLHAANAYLRDERYRALLRAPRGKQRTAGFAELRCEYGLTKMGARGLATRIRNDSGWLCDHVPSNTAQREAADVYVGVNEWLLGKRGKPRHKPSSGCNTMWGAGKSASIKFRDDELVISAGLERKQLALHHTVNAERLGQLMNGGAVTSAGVTREAVRGKTRYFALLRVTGAPYRSPQYLSEVNNGVVVGLDAGPSKLAVASNGTGFFLYRAPAGLLAERREAQKLIRRRQRALDRSRRATNPECFDTKGRFIKGKKITTRSKAYERTKKKLAAEQRKLRVQRRQDETVLAREVMRVGNHVAVEDVDYRSWQASFYGKRMGFTAPGALMARTKEEALLTGGGVTELPLKLALSQHCVCGRRARKTLGERVHSCPACGLVADRDLNSARLCELIVLSGLDPATLDLSRGPLRGVAAARLYPVAGKPETGGGSAPRGVSVKPALAGSPMVDVAPGNTHGDSEPLARQGRQQRRAPNTPSGGNNAT